MMPPATKYLPVLIKYFSALQRQSAVTTPTLKLRKRPSKYSIGIRLDIVVTANLT